MDCWIEIGGKREEGRDGNGRTRDASLRSG
jgi:hypothetical protein